MTEFYMSGRSNVETYSLHGTDVVEAYTRMINGREYEFSRVTWEDGAVTVRAWSAQCDTLVVHEWGRPG
jgi:hypothetical protein